MHIKFHQFSSILISSTQSLSQLDESDFVDFTSKLDPIILNSMQADL